MNKRTVNLIIVLSTLIIVALLSYFFILPSYSKMTAAQENLQNQETTYAQDKKQIEDIKNNESYYQEVIKNLSKTEALIPSQKDIDNFVIQLEELSKRSNCGLESFEITTPIPTSTKKSEGEGSTSNQGQTSEQSQGSSNTTKTPLTQVAKVGNFYALSFELKLTGSYDSILNYLTLMEHMNRIVTIKKLKLTLANTTSNSLEATIDGIIYIKP